MVTRDEFLDQVDKFIKIAGRVGDEWTKRFALPDDNSVPYLERRCLNVVSESEQQKAALQSGGVKSVGKFIVCTYHVIFNEPYGVPQLLFTAAKSDGSLVPLTVFHSLIPSSLLGSSANEESDPLWETLTQIEHPLLHVPFYALHPCRTAQVISHLRRLTSDWFVPWLSAAGPAIGLRLPLEYGREAH